MMISIYLLTCFLAVLQFNSNLVLSQRDFANPAVTDPAPCSCDLRAGACDPNCCCDSDCSNADLSASPVCQSTRTTSTDPSTKDVNLQTWMCSNSTSAALYDYFPFVCVQLGLNEIFGKIYPTDSVTFVKTTDTDDATNLRSLFVTENPELFQSYSLSSSTFAGNYSIGAPLQTPTALFTLPGNLVGSVCQSSVQVLFGVNSDVSCTSNTSFCTSIIATQSFLKGGDTTSTVPVIFYTTTATVPTPSPADSVTEYYMQYSFTSSISNISFTPGSIDDYCPGRYPITRTQRYGTTCATSPDISRCGDQYQIWSGCQLRDSLSYSSIPASFFTARTTVTDDATDFSDFTGSTITTAASLCTGSTVQRVYYQFNYLSTDNTISSVNVYVLFAAAAATTSNLRITIVWNDVATNAGASTTIPRGYLPGELLQFSRNGASSDVSSLVPSSSGYCVDATRTTLRYKKSTSSYCFVQLKQATVQKCHDLKLNMYLYLNAFYAPASAVYSYPNVNATAIPIRDVTQDSLDLDRIDETRANNRLNTSYIIQTRLNTTSYAIYDTTQNLPVCYNVPSGIYIEFGFVRVSISPTISYERIVSVQYNYTYSNWQFDCNQGSCDTTVTQRYLVTFQSAFVDLTNSAFDLSDTTTADLTSSDDYIQHLLWLITPQYTGEPGYRKYTIAMILIFIAISAVVVHVLLFGIMCPF